MSENQHPIAQAHARMAEAETLRQQGKRAQARRICEGLIKKYPDYVGALHTLGLVLADGGDFQGALLPLVRASMLNPRDWRTLTALSGVYLELGSSEMAARTLEQALKSHPDDVNTLTMLGQIYAEDEEHELAAETYARVVELEPTLMAAHIELGDALMDLGDVEQAARTFERLYAGNIRTLRVCYQLGQLPAALSDIDYAETLDGLKPAAGASRQDFDSALLFTRATLADKQHRHEEAWQHLVGANRHPSARLAPALKKASEGRERDLNRIRGLTAPKPAPHQADLPMSLFVLGPSRSGKTTVERLLSAHADVKRGYENSITENIARRAFQSAGFIAADMVSMLSPALLSAARDYYKEELLERAGSAKVFTNTTPGLVSDLIGIAQVVPNAFYVFVKRDPIDIVTRIYMKNYARGNAYSYTVSAAFDYVEWYYEMIDLMVERLPDRSIVVQYEDVVSDPASLISKVSDLIGIDLRTDTPPVAGDDRGCGLPYRDYLLAARQA